jgi:hypothetical protein
VRADELVNRFHMGVSRESIFVAWVAVPIVAANLGIVPCCPGG